MAISPLQIPQSNISNAVDPSQWNTLANLGNVYRDAQTAMAKKATLASLGSDPQANMQTLISSGDPSLAQIGLNLQQKGIEQAREDARNVVTDKRADSLLAIQQAAARRAQETYDKSDADEAAAAKLIGGLYGGGAQPPVQPRAPVASSPTVWGDKEAEAAGLYPPKPPTQPQATVPTVPTFDQRFGAAQPTDPNASPIAPTQLEASGALAAGVPVSDRVASNLTSPQPAAAAGVTRGQIGELYKNPLTRPLAVAFLQKQMNPGDWKYEKTEDGRIIAVNSLDPTKTKDVTPPTSTGDPAASKQEREVQGYYNAGIKLGMSPEQAQAYAANKGKTPSEDLHPDERKQINSLSDMANTGQRVIANINELKQLSPKAWGYPGAETVAEYTSGYLPSAITPQGAVNTQDLTNAARTNVTNMAKSIFGARITNQDLKLLQELEGSANQTDAVRQKIFDRATTMVQGKIDEAKTEADRIRNKSFYKPGGGAPAAAPAAAPGDRPPLASIFGQ